MNSELLFFNVIISLISFSRSSTLCETPVAHEVVIGSQVIEPSYRGPNTCSGSLKIFCGSDSEPVIVTQASINRMRAWVEKVTIVGNCCWGIYNKKGFKGRSAMLS